MLFDSLRPWRPGETFFLEPLETPRPISLRLDRFPRGVDNLHVDVALGRSLVTSARAYVEFILRDEVERNFWREGGGHLNTAAPEMFRKQYAAVTKRVVHEARAQSRSEWVQLFQLSLLKLLLLLVDVEFSRLRKAIEAERSNDGARESGRSVTLHEQLVALGRYERLIRQRCSQRVIKGLEHMERAGLAKLRNTVLGKSWPVPQYLVFNPLLPLGGLGEDETFLTQYPLLLQDVAHFSRINRAFWQCFKYWLPAWVEPPAGPVEVAARPVSEAPAGVRGLESVEGFLAQCLQRDEYRKPHTSWLDQPDNLRAMFAVDRSKVGATAWRNQKWAGFVARQLKRFIRTIGRDELLAEAAVSYRLSEVYPDLGLKGQVPLVHAFLKGELSPRKLETKLPAALSEDERREVLTRLKSAKATLHKGETMQPQALAVRLLIDYARLRRDLKVADVAYRAMNQIRLLLDPQEIELSRSNGLLQVFDVGEAGAVEREVTGHVILKADIRGSTLLTRQMRERNLNPAAHFSRTLYDPINALLKYFDATKVFVEGDAVILMLLEKAGAHLAVARACGLASKLLSILEAKAAESRRLGLPELEVGVGIAYCDESPTYLYDEGRRITISPAINTADRLSSCNRELRQLLRERAPDQRGVEVAMPVLDRTQATDRDEEDLVRCNVNGVELDATTFYHLRAELDLKKVERREASSGAPMVYHIGHYPDMRGNIRWLVIRESPVRLWIGNELVAGERDGRHFYQVVTDPRLIEELTHSPEIGEQRQKILP